MPAWKIYRDFVIKIERANNKYRVEAQGPTGEAESSFIVPFHPLEIENFLLRIGRPRSARHRGRVPKPLQPTIDFGGRLFDALLTGQARDVFMQARHDAEINGYGLRVKLRLNAAPELADLPWEFLYDGRDFLALNDATPLVRYLDLPNPPRPMQVDLPLRILVTVSAPHDLPPLNVDLEQRKIMKALSDLIEDGLVAVDFTEDATLNRLQRRLRRARADGRPYHVWHYIGHGEFDPGDRASVLALTDRDNRFSPAGGFQLGTLFAAYPNLRLVLLNACEGARPNKEDPFAGVAASLIERGIPAVIGMQFEITDKAAISLSEEFYTALVDGLPVDAAMAEARRAVFFLPNWVEWATPVLFMRVGDGQLFEVTGQPAPQQSGLTPQIVVRDPEPPTRYDFEPEMVLIPAGPFLMGSPTSDQLRYDGEPEQFELLLDYDYTIGKYPVTVGQYRAFMEAGGYRENRWWTDAGWQQRQSAGWRQPRYWGDKKWTGDDLLPVVGVSWYEAFAYTQWLAEATGREYRLLREAEWEKAARGGLQIPDGKGSMKKNPHPARIWPWGDDEPTKELCNFEGNVGQTSVVTSHAAQATAQPYGLFHMAGNVWEWCLSEWANPYQHPEQNDPADDSPRVLRGGSWLPLLDHGPVRCLSRGGADPHNRSSYYGFRVGGVVPGS